MTAHECLVEAERLQFLGELEQSVWYASVAADDFARHHDWMRLILALLVRSAGYRELFSFQQDYGFLQRAESDATGAMFVVEEHQVKPLYSLACFHIAEVALALRNFEDALYYLHCAILDRSFVPLFHRGRYYFRLGEAHYLHEKAWYKKYGKHLMVSGFSQMSELAGEMQPLVYWSWLVDSHLALAAVFGDEGNHDVSLRHLAEAEQIAERVSGLGLGKKKLVVAKQRLSVS
jgi:hypothetical protein